VTIGDTVAMCTRRLRIVGASNGVQPQTSFDGRFLVSVNGGIYNHVALRDQLATFGAVSAPSATPR
jgi:asparagine synthase (glutamine-hydrolysing)